MVLYSFFFPPGLGVRDLASRDSFFSIGYLLYLVFMYSNRYVLVVALWGSSRLFLSISYAMYTSLCFFSGVSLRVLLFLG